MSVDRAVFAERQEVAVDDELGVEAAAVVIATLEADADPVPVLKLQAETWELNVWAALEDFARLRTIRDAKWAERTSLAVGTCAGSLVFWAMTDDGHATILVGSDDETWDCAVTVPLEVVDEVAALAS